MKEHNNCVNNTVIVVAVILIAATVTARPESLTPQQPGQEPTTELFLLVLW